MAEFDRLAPDYDALLEDSLRDRFASGSRFFLTRKVDVLRDFAARQRLDRTGATWIDVGCGTGELLRADRGAYGRALGCDVSSGMLARCTGLNVVQQVDPLRLPFADATADWVTAVCVFHHVPIEHRAALTAEIRRVLRPGGFVAVIEHNPWNPAVQVIVRRTPVDANARLLTARHARALLCRAGIDAVDTRYFLLLPEMLQRRVGAVESVLEHMPLGGQYVVFGRKG
jgi:SAM-dependent methyltransferase